MAKRGAESQGRKETGFDDENQRGGIDEPVKTATAAQMAKRNIASAKTRRRPGAHPPSGSPSPSPFQPQSMSNPFAGFQSNAATTNGDASSAPDMSKQNSGSAFGQSGFQFGSSQSFPATNGTNNNNSNTNGGLFSFGKPAPQSNSFPPAQNGNNNSNGNLFGNLSASSGGFTFGSNNATGTNPFAKPATSQNSNASQPTNIFGAPSTSGFQGFGQQNSAATNGIPAQQPSEVPQATSPGNDSMQISPPTTPSKGTTASAAHVNATNIFGQPLNPATSTSTSTSAPPNNSTSVAASNPFSGLSNTPSLFRPQTSPSKNTQPTEQSDSTRAPNFFKNPNPASSIPGLSSNSAGAGLFDFGGKDISSKPTPTPANNASFSPQNQSPFDSTSSYQTHTPAVDSTSPSQGSDNTLESQRRLQALNQGFRKAISTMSSRLDWSSMMEAYQSERQKIRDFASSTSSSAASSSIFGKRKATENVPSDNKRSRPSERPAATPDLTPSRSQTSNLFQSIVDGNSNSASANQAQGAAKPAPSTPANMFAPSKQAPATAPPVGLFANRLGDANPPANGSPMFAAPQTASKAQAPPKPASGTTASSGIFAGFSQPAPETSTGSVFGSGNTGTPRSNMFGNLAGSKAPASDLFGPKQPATSPAKSGTDTETQQSAPAFQVPKFGAGANVTNMLSQFAQKTAATAKEMAEEAKKKKKQDEFDSEDEDENEEDWEKKYAEEQAAKKKQLTEAPKAVFVPGQGFVFKAAEPSADSASESGHASDTGNATGDESDQPAASREPSSNGDGTSIFGTGSQLPKASGQALDKPSGGSNIFGHLSASQSQASQDGDDESEDGEALEDEMHRKSQREPASVSSGKSLFDRVTAGSPTKGGTAGSQSTFGQSSTFGSNIFGNSQTSPGDHTWKKNEPIKFGASTSGVNGINPFGGNGGPDAADPSTPKQKPFAGLFGAGKADPTPSLFSQNLQSTTPKGSPAKPASETMGFGFTPKLAAPSPSLFSSAVTSNTPSRASTPGTDANNTSDANSGDEEPLLDQSDLTSLSAEEVKNEEILFEAAKAKVMRYDKEEAAWKTLGTGPLRVLKNKESGLVRILMRIAPSGKLVINAPLLKGMTYKKAQKGVVQFGAADMEGSLKTWYARMGKDEVANKFAEVCEANKGA